MILIRVSLIIIYTFASYYIGCGTVVYTPPVYLPEITIYPKDYNSIILDILSKNGIKGDLAKTILAQAIHESGNFSSNIFIENNNCFGMKCPRKRPTTCIGSNRGHGMYGSVEDAITDYLLWMEHFNIPKDCTTKKYIFLLKRKHYFQDDVNRYYRAIKKHKL